MYQIYVRHFADGSVWARYHRPFLVRSTAEEVINNLIKLDAEINQAGIWIYKIEEVV